VPDNKDLAAQVASEQTLVAQADAERAQAKADQAKAEAQVAVSKAEAQKQAATIAGFQLKGMTPRQAVRAYNESQAIAAGLNPYQPTFVVSGSAGATP
jgi:regulator of protease activity HflC (stomatin/prohibitin superfamily)